VAYFVQCVRTLCLCHFTAESCRASGLFSWTGFTFSVRVMILYVGTNTFRYWLSEEVARLNAHLQTAV